jgi:hypothetical protein
MDYIESVGRVGLALEECLMLQKKHSSKENASSLKKKGKKRKHQDEADQREDKTTDCGSGGKATSKKPKKEDMTKGQTPVHKDKKKALDRMALFLVVAQFERVSVLAVACTTRYGNVAQNQSFLHPLKAKG